MSDYRKLMSLVARTSDFLRFSCILEVGSRDGYDASKLARFAPKAQVYAFECNPDTIDRVRAHAALNPRIQAVQNAVGDHEGSVEFWPVDMQGSASQDWPDGNPGASSLFKLREGMGGVKQKAKSVKVPMLRLDDFLRSHNVKHVDLIWMDIQGAESMALKGLADKARDVRFIYLEVSTRETYAGEPLFADIKAQLNAMGFKTYGIINPSSVGGDALFVNMALVDNPLERRYLTLMNATAALRARLEYRLTALRHRLLSAFFMKLRHPLVQLANRVRRHVFLALRKAGLGGSVTPAASRVPLSVVMPVGPADVAIAPLAIAALRKHLKHPLAQIFVVGPAALRLHDKARGWGATFVDEKEVLPAGFSEYPFDFTMGKMNRRGWMLQQLIKLNADCICSTEHVFVADADTLYVNDFTVVDEAGKPVFFTSDEYHLPYHRSAARLLGVYRRFIHSFVAHGMVFEKTQLQALRDHMEDLFGVPWWQAILRACDKTQISPFSEFETYGNFMAYVARRPFVSRYWNNTLLARPETRLIEPQAQALAGEFRSVSFHALT